MSAAYISDMTHFLDEDGEIPKAMPKPARELASFMALIVDQASSALPDTAHGIETGIRCRTKACEGNIIGALDDNISPVHWHCRDCGLNGVISNWQRTKWDNTEPQ